MTDEQPEKKEDDDAWIEKVVNVAGNLGFDRMRLRWKLIRWQERRRKAKRRREQQVQHITYAHKTCGECGAVQDKDEAVCSSCGAKLGKRGFQVLGRLGILMPVGASLSTVLAIGILVAYARVWIAQGGGFSAPSPYLLIDFGGRWPPLVHDEPWRLVTSIFLHGGLWHLAFNLLAIASVGPRIEELYGKGTTLFLFVATGVLANLGSLAAGTFGVGIGASGGLMGLIGIAAGYGHRAGRGRGHGLRDDMLKWSAYTFIFGFAVGADNWAHLFGLVAGILFGVAVRPIVWQKLRVLHWLLGLVGATASIGAIVIILTRQASAPDANTAQAMWNQKAQEDAIAEMTKSTIDMCVPFYAGDTGTALAVAQKTYAHLEQSSPLTRIDARMVEQMCEGIQQLRAGCAEDRAKYTREQRAQVEQMCAMYKDVFAAIPVRAPKVPLDPGMLVEEVDENGEPTGAPVGSGAGSGSAPVR